MFVFVTNLILIFVLPSSFVCFGRKQKLRLNCVASIYPVCNGETCGLVACFMWVKLNVLVFLYVIFVFVSVIQILYLYLVSVSESVFGMGQTDVFVFIFVFLIQNYWWLVSINDYSVDKGRHPKKNTGFFGNFSQRGGGSSQFPKLFKINQDIFGMPKSFLGAKTCFTIVGR